MFIELDAGGQTKKRFIYSLDVTTYNFKLLRFLIHFNRLILCQLVMTFKPGFNYSHPPGPPNIADLRSQDWRKNGGIEKIANVRFFASPRIGGIEGPGVDCKSPFVLL